MNREATTAAAPVIDPRFAPAVRAFAKDRRVTYGGKGFGSTGLKVDGKLFAMISSKDQFVAKLPKVRVDELVRSGVGEYFDPGHGRLMKQWVALTGAANEGTDLAKEARRGDSSERMCAEVRTRHVGSLPSIQRP